MSLRRGQSHTALVAVTPDDPVVTPDGLAVLHVPVVPRAVAFQCDVAHFEERAVVSVRGDLDLATAPVLQREAFATLAQPIRCVVLDLGYCTFMDSSGVSVLVAASHRALERKIEFRLTSVPRQVRVVLELSGLAEEFGLAEGPDPKLPPSPRGSAP